MAVRYHIRRAHYVVEGVIHPEDTFQVGHEVFNFCNQIRRELERNTKASAPPNISKARYDRSGQGTGELNRGIKANMHRVGPEEIDLIVSSSVYYTMWVHGGTAFKKGGNFIYSKEGFANRGTVDALIASGFKHSPGQKIPENLKPLFMGLPPLNGFALKQLRVRGQRANPFLYRGFNVTALDHECLGGQFVGIVGLGSLI